MRLLTHTFALTRSRFYALVYIVLIRLLRASKFFRDEDLSICLETPSDFFNRRLRPLVNVSICATPYIVTYTYR